MLSKQFQSIQKTKRIKLRSVLSTQTADYQLHLIRLLFYKTELEHDSLSVIIIVMS